MRPRPLLGAVLAVLGACVPARLDLFDSDTATDPGTTTTSTTTGANTSAGPGTTTGTTDPLTTTATTDGGPVSCDDPITNCDDDRDRDGLIFACDNAPHHPNPDQSDIDGDGVGDIVDVCPTLANADAQKADADRDGIGNDCDVCPHPPSTYNDGPDVIPPNMRVRNIPQVEDSDHDGVGDACDNCVRTPNCQGYGLGDGLEPYDLGDPIDQKALDCQEDGDLDLVGDACAGTMLPGAAGPVGLGPTDDFDQDGLPNLTDVCPRQPVAMQPCDGPADCPDSGTCTAGVCNHRDTDGDGVGDICDTCPWSANPEQIQDGGAQQDDPDGDFVGNACETHSTCFDFADPRPFGFYDLSVGGYCCVRMLPDAVLDPHGDPVEPPPGVLDAPGVGVLPPGCTQEGQPLNHADVEAPLWATFCLLPQLDQDFDGVGYNCDLCPFAFDPGQEIYVDEDDVEWPHHGKFCNGEFEPSNFDPALMCYPGD